MIKNDLSEIIIFVIKRAELQVFEVKIERF